MGSTRENKSVYFKSGDELILLQWAEEQAMKNKQSFSSFVVSVLLEKYEGKSEPASQGRVLARLDQIEKALLARLEANLSAVPVQSPQPYIGHVAETKIVDTAALDSFLGDEEW